MANPEYIRAVSSQAKSSVLSLPVDGKSAILTFLHADHSRWSENDVGSSNAAERGHSHSVYHAILYTSGRNTMIHQGRSMDFSRGTLVLTDPGCIHEYRPQGFGGGSFIEITFDLRLEKQALSLPWIEILTTWFGNELTEPVWPLTIPPPHLERLETLMGAIVTALTDGGRFAESEASLSMGEFLLFLCRYVESETRDKSESEADGLERARLALERQFAKGIAVKELAEIACLSEGAFIRNFSARYGISPIGYRKKLRITAAQHLLSVSGRSIGEIASNVGYGDIYSFSRTFKSVTGMTAREWRKKAGEAE